MPQYKITTGYGHVMDDDDLMVLLEDLKLEHGTIAYEDQFGTSSTCPSVIDNDERAALICNVLGGEASFVRLEDAAWDAASGLG